MHIDDDDRIGQFGLGLKSLPAWDSRRIGMILIQAGVLLTTAAFCVSIAALNVGLVTALFGCLMARAPIHHAIGAKVLLAYVVWLGLSTFTNHEYLELIKTGIVPVGLVVAQVALHPAVPGAQRLRKYMCWALIVAVLAALVVTLGQFFIGKGRNPPFRIDPAGQSYSLTSGLLSFHLNQGGVMGMLFFLLAAMTMGISGVWRWVAMGSTVIAVVLSGARSALLGLAVAMSTMIGLQGRRFLLIGSLVGMIMLTSGLVVLYLTSPGRFDRLMTLQDGRWPIWRASIHVIKDHPLFGTGGTDKFKAAYRETYPRVVLDIPTEFPNGAGNAHNTHLAHAAEHGIPLAILWLVMLMVPLGFLWRRRVDNPFVFRVGVGVVVMVLTFGQFEKVDEEPERVLWTGLGILLALSRFPRVEPEIPTPLPNSPAA